MTHKQKQQPWGVFIAIILGVLIGIGSQQGVSLLGFSPFDYLYPVYKVCGKIFINALTLVVVPLVAASVITGIARLGNDGSLGRLGVKMFSFYLGTSLFAILIGVLFVNLLHPGTEIRPDVLLSSVDPSTMSQHLSMQEKTSFLDIFLQIVPSNIIESLSKGQMLGVIFFSLIFGYCISKVKSKCGSVLFEFWQGIFEAMIQFTQIIMKVLPLGVFFLVAQVFAESGLKSLASLGLFTLTILMGLATFMFVGLPLLLRWVAKVKPSRHFKAMAPALVTAFSTSSSSATLPVTIDCVEKRAGVSHKICSLVVPLGTSINMSGSALYACAAAMFVAQAYEIALPLSTQIVMILLSLITSIGVAGVPSGSLIAIIAILKTMGLPAEGIGLFIAVDRILDMCRSTVNVFSDSCCAVLVAKSEGEEHILSKDEFTS